MKILHPEGWPRPKGYSNGVSTRGELVFIAGLIGWDPQGNFPSDLLGQFRRTLENTVAVLNEARARPEHIVRMTWYLTDLSAYLAAPKEIGAIYREILGAVYPAMAVIEVAGLVEKEALIEIETTAVIPE
jgi:enamine deaminase RidA (YjgF/YER057c/UK114 family)